jgi:hypothetical protein
MKVRALLLAVLLGASGLFVPGPSELVVPGAAATPSGDLTPVGGQVLMAGVRYTKYRWRRSSAPIYIAQVMRGGNASVKVISARDRIGGGRETVYSMCLRTKGCIAAVNGDFWDTQHSSAAALGGVISRGELWKSPNPFSQQTSVAPPKLGLTWSGTLTNDAGMTVRLAGVNVDPVPNRVVLYTPRYGQPLGGVRKTSFKVTAPAQLLGRLGAKTPLTHLGSGAVGTRVHPGQAGFVASGSAGAALWELFSTGGVTLTLSTNAPTTESIGFHPAVLRDGHWVKTDPHDSMLTEANPRTMLAWNSSRTWLIAADGRERGGAGLRISDVVALVQHLRATNAVMLDGGGSTTFDVRGHILNHPSDGKLRPVSNALAVIVSGAH